MGGFFHNSENNKPVKTFPQRWDLIEGSIAEALGIQRDQPFSGQQCIRIVERGAPNGVLDLGQNGKINIDKVPTYSQSDRYYRVPKADSQGMIPEDVIPASVNPQAAPKASYYFEGSMVQIEYNGLFRSSAYSIFADQNFRATDPVTGLPSLFLPPGTYFLIFCGTPILLLEAVTGTLTTVDLWISPLMPIIPISPGFPATIKMLAKQLYAEGSTTWAMGVHAVTLSYFFTTSTNQFVHVNVGRVASKPGDPVVVGAIFFGTANVLKVA